MDSPGPSTRGSNPGEASRGVNRPLPPVPDPELDLYSGDDPLLRRLVRFPRTSVNNGSREEVETHESRQESQGESSRAASRALSVENLIYGQNYSDAKGSRRGSMRASVELARPASQTAFENYSSRTRSISTPSQNNALPPIPSSRPRNSSDTQQQYLQDNDSSFHGDEEDDAMENRRVQRIEVLPGVANFRLPEGQLSQQYRLDGDPRVVLPRWQPDAEVSTCPICNSVFSVFNRKHHCRKCGKVVCASCSPHRITIPREYIVRPPAGVVVSTPRVSRSFSASGQTPGVGEGIEAGERVRLCNPCVPDPNTAPPQASPPPYSASNTHTVRPEDQLPRFMEYRVTGREGSYRPRPNATPLLPDFDGPLPADLIRVLPQPQNPGPPRTAANARADAPGANNLYNASQVANHESLGPNSRYVTQAEHDLMRRNRNLMLGTRTVIEANPNPSRAQPIPGSIPRRVIPEEDCCPVCGGEYPLQFRGNTQLQEEHVERCIAEQSGRGNSLSSRPAVVNFATPPDDQLYGMPLQTRRGMTRYIATAKDAVIGDECQICLDEFLPSQELALLTCFCKYHSECILNWWNQGQYGKCPTHNHGL